MDTSSRAEHKSKPGGASCRQSVYIINCLPDLLYNAAKLLSSDGAVMFGRATVAAANDDG